MAVVKMFLLLRDWMLLVYTHNESANIPPLNLLPSIYSKVIDYILLQYIIYCTYNIIL